MTQQTILYLLDTNILSALIKQPHSILAKRISSLDSSVFCTSIIVACELRYGAKKKASPELIRKIEILLSNIMVLPLSDDVDRHYAVIRADLEKKGQVISANDMLIAAHALALDVIVITNNEKEFQRVPALRVENWLQDIKS
ncbi:MAG: type II toxin-antitoxin system VapC family toxin [Legionellales bacterium]|nr:type II toxin-antitoxin system VapC family toxin [Legionellales bacterium]